MTTIVINTKRNSDGWLDDNEIFIDGVRIETQRYSIEERIFKVWFRAEVIIEHKLTQFDTVVINYL